MTLTTSSSPQALFISPRFGAIQRTTPSSPVHFGSDKENKKKKTSDSSEPSKLWAGVKLAGIAALGFMFAAPLAGAFAGLSAMDIGLAFVVPTLIDEVSGTETFDKIKKGLGTIVYNPLHSVLSGIGDLFGVNGGGKTWADKSLEGINPERLKDILQAKAKAKELELNGTEGEKSGAVKSLFGLREHFKKLTSQDNLAWGEAMTHTIYSALIITRNRLSVKAIWKTMAAVVEKEGIFGAIGTIFSRKFWSELGPLKTGFSLFKFIKSFIVGNIILRAATEALESAATLFLPKGRWAEIKAKEEQNVANLTDELNPKDTNTEKTEGTNAKENSGATSDS